MSTTPESHAHATRCRDRPRTISLPQLSGGHSLTTTVLHNCLNTWSGQIRDLGERLSQDWSQVAHVHRRIAAQDQATAAAL